jgi:hypothetical protein
MSKKKIYYGLLLFFTIFISTASTNSTAHAPSAINLAYDLDTQVLTVSIRHGVTNPTTHYVYSVTISVNGSTVLTGSYTSQPSSLNFNYEYNITANNGAEIQALAICQQGGSLAACIVVGSGLCGQGGGGEIPGYIGLWIIIGCSVIVLTIILNKKMKRISR